MNRVGWAVEEGIWTNWKKEYPFGDGRLALMG